ncbi:hypothetical protein KM043_011564 [Ampulex compressa]|nr:hypothetical protein KM043_011564 [Ampulex compressa]
MIEDLLAKEKEFHKINKKLEDKTRNLIKEVDVIINKQGTDTSVRTVEIDRFCTTLSPREKTQICPQDQNKIIETRIRHGPFLSHESAEAYSHSSKEKSKPQKTNAVDKQLSKAYSSENKAVVNFLHAKVDMLQKELELIQVEYKKKCDYCKDLEADKKKDNDEKIKLHSQITALKDTVAKLEDTNAGLQTQLQAVNTENCSLKRDIDGLKKDIKMLNQQSQNYDVRLNRSSENIEKLRNTLKLCNIEEKELRNQIRKLHEDKRLAVKNLEKQRSELLQIFKRQVLLTENLRKQNIYLMANVQVQWAKEEFMKLLNWKPNV